MVAGDTNNLRSDDSELAGEVKQRLTELAREIKRLRQERRLSQNKLAELTVNTGTHVRNTEHPDKGVPSREVITAIDIALEAGGWLIKLRDHAYDALVRRRDALKKTH
jgi:transcriptional regulator with XRE-family HTH domain